MHLHGVYFILGSHVGHFLVEQKGKEKKRKRQIIFDHIYYYDFFNTNKLLF